MTWGTRKGETVIYLERNVDGQRPLVLGIRGYRAENCVAGRSRALDNSFHTLCERKEPKSIGWTKACAFLRLESAACFSRD